MGMERFLRDREKEKPSSKGFLQALGTFDVPDVLIADNSLTNDKNK